MLQRFRRAACVATIQDQDANELGQYELEGKSILPDVVCIGSKFYKRIHVDRRGGGIYRPATIHIILPKERIDYKGKYDG